MSDPAATGQGIAPPPLKGTSSKSMFRFVLELVRPYRKWLIIVFIAMLIETAMSIAAPWPLKIILDNVVGKHKLPEFLTWLRDFSSGEHTLALAGVAALGVIVIAAIGAVAGYIDNYYTESVAQYVANDLRQRLYHHLQRLSLKYYDTHQIGNMVSTITSDVSTIQSFASTALLSILVDALTIIGMLGVMLYLNFDFALIVVVVTPVLLFFISHFKKAVKKATHEVRKRQSEIVGVVEQGLQSVRSVKAFGRQDTEEERLKEVSLATVQAALKARRVKSLLSPIVSVTVSLLRGLRALARGGADPERRHDHRFAHGLPFLSQQVLQARAGSRENDQRHRAGRGRPGARPDDPRGRYHHPGKARRARPRQAQGRDRFRARRLCLRPRRAGAARHQPHDQARDARRRLRPDRRRQIDHPFAHPALLRSDARAAC